MKSSILSLIDFSTPESNWKAVMPSVDEIDYWSITNRIKTRQKIIPIGGGNMIVTAGYAEGCTVTDNDGYERWRNVALCLMGSGDGNICSVCQLYCQMSGESHKCQDSTFYCVP